MKRAVIFSAAFLFFIAMAGAQTVTLTKVKPADSLRLNNEKITKQLRPATAKTQKILLTGFTTANADAAVLWLAAKRNQNVYKVRLAIWLDKYAGETEKNLDILLEQAAGSNTVLFFDEADALFSKNGQENKVPADALLQKISNYKGIVVINCTAKDCPAFNKWKFTQVRSDP